MTGRIQSSSQRCYFGEKNGDMLCVCCQGGTIVKVWGSLSLQEQEFPREMSGKPAGKGMVLGQEAASALCAWVTAGKREAVRRTGGVPQLSRTEHDHKGWFVFTFSLTQVCKTVFIIPPHPSTSQNLAESGHV